MTKNNEQNNFKIMIPVNIIPFSVWLKCLPIPTKCIVLYILCDCGERTMDEHEFLSIIFVLV